MSLVPQTWVVYILRYALCFRHNPPMRLNPAASILVLTALLSGCSEQAVSPSGYVKAQGDDAHREVIYPFRKLGGASAY